MKRTLTGMCTAAAIILLTACAGPETKTGSDGQNDPAVANANLGLAYMERGEYQVALDKLKKALEINPDLPQAHHYIAMVYQKLGNVGDAEKHFERAVSLDGSDSALQNNYGTFLFAEGRYKDAKKELQRAADDPDYARRAQAFENLGLTELKLDETDAAKASFQRALLLNASMPRSHLELAQIEFSTGNFAAAKENFDRYNAMAKPTARSLWLGIRLSRVLHDQDQLASYALALRNLFPDSEEYRLYQDRQW